VLVGIAAQHVQLPFSPSPGTWGYGVAVKGVPGTTSVLFTLPGGARTPWCTADLTTGRLIRGTSLPGPLRDVHFPSMAEDDPRPWVLGCYGLGRLRFEPRPTVTDVIRKGLGKDQTSLIDLGPGLLGVGHRRLQTLTMVDTVDGGIVKRVRVGGPLIGYPLSDGRVRIFGLHHAQACDLDVPARKVVARHALPYGSDALLADDAVLAVLGERRDIKMVYRVEDLPDEGPGVLGVGMPPNGESDKIFGWHVAPRRIAVIGADDLAVRRESPAPPQTRQILGTDRDGRIVVSTATGVVLLDPVTLSPLAEHSTPRQNSGAGMCSGTNAAAVLGGEEDESILTILRW
jgi:hypothetical protein